MGGGRVFECRVKVVCLLAFWAIRKARNMTVFHGKEVRAENLFRRDKKIVLELVENHQIK